MANPSEGAKQHFHAHLDIIVDGKPVSVPAGLGIDTRQQLIAELHTHNDSGILHVESASRSLTFNLGQLFVEWGGKLDAENVGGLSTGNHKHLVAYVNGERLQGDPSEIQLADHLEIVLVYGAGTPQKVPASYNFAAHNV